jgi:hypothetical protein
MPHIYITALFRQYAGRRAARQELNLTVHAKSCHAMNLRRWAVLSQAPSPLDRDWKPWMHGPEVLALLLQVATSASPYAYRACMHARALSCCGYSKDFIQFHPFCPPFLHSCSCKSRWICRKRKTKLLNLLATKQLSSYYLLITSSLCNNGSTTKIAPEIHRLQSDVLKKHQRISSPWSMIIGFHTGESWHSQNNAINKTIAKHNQLKIYLGFSPTSLNTESCVIASTCQCCGSKSRITMPKSRHYWDTNLRTQDKHCDSCN